MSRNHLILKFSQLKWRTTEGFSFNIHADIHSVWNFTIKLSLVFYAKNKTFYNEVIKSLTSPRQYDTKNLLTHKSAENVSL